MGEAKRGRAGVYGEPWNTYMGTLRGTGVERPFVQGADAEGEFDRIIMGADTASRPPLSPDELVRRMRRAANCVNAMEDIPDPSSYRAAVDALREAAEGAEALIQALYPREGVPRGHAESEAAWLVEDAIRAALARLESGEGEERG